MNLVKNLLQDGDRNKHIFIEGSDGQLTFQDFDHLVEADIQTLRKRAKAPSCIALQAKNHFASYSRFLASLREGHTVLLVAPHQFNDTAYRHMLVTETNLQFAFWDDQDLYYEHSTSEAFPSGPHFIVRTSGSSGGKYKFALHDANRFIKKYQVRGVHYKKTLAFSPADSIAGVETLLEAITLGATLVVGGDRLNPQKAVDLLAEFQIDYFQTTPTFMNMLVLTKVLNAERLNHLLKIAYGSEPSSPTTVKTIQSTLPNVLLNHTYGMTEIGIQITKTDPEDASLFILDSNFNPGRIVDNLVEVQSLTPMIKYLNAPDPRKDSDWFPTGDKVKEEHGFWRILGREGDLINVAGRKFFPADLENIIMTMPGVGDVTVIAEKNELLGQSLTVKILGSQTESELEFRKRFKYFCEQKVPYFMQPQKVHYINPGPQETIDASFGRFKKIRRS